MANLACSTFSTLIPPDGHPTILSVAATLIIFLSLSSPFLLTKLFLPQGFRTCYFLFLDFLPLFSQLIPICPSNINPGTIFLRKPFLT